MTVISFTSIPFVVVKLKKFQSFSYQFTIHVGSILEMLFAYFFSICGPILVKLWPPCYPLKMAEIRKKNFYPKKKIIIRLSKYIKTGEHHRPNGQNQNLTQHISPKWLLTYWIHQNFGSSIFQFCGCRYQTTFQRNLTPVFASLAALLETTSTFVKENDK